MPSAFGEYVGPDSRLDCEAGYTEVTYLYRYFTDAGRLLYTGISNQPSARHWAHRNQIWWPHAALIRYERFPNRDVALIAESISIEDEGPDHNAHVRLRVRRWPRDSYWYRDKMGGEFRGEEPAWFWLDGWDIGERCEAPDWWAEPFRQAALHYTESLTYQAALQAAEVMAAALKGVETSKDNPAFGGNSSPVSRQWDARRGGTHGVKR